MAKINLQPAWLLHQRAYKESSRIVDFLTLEYGKVSVVAKGVARRNSNKAALLQPFQPLQISWVGRGELGTLSDIEHSGERVKLTGKATYIGFYLNELLLRLLPKSDKQTNLFAAYMEVIDNLAANQNVSKQQMEHKLRFFEKQLLQSIGYGINLDTDYDGEEIREDARYSYLPDVGFSHNINGFISGVTINMLTQDNLTSKQALQEAKQLLRLALSHQLGNKPLQSRKLFEKLNAKNC